MQPGELSSANPVGATLDYGPTTFRVYGLAIDGVTGIEPAGRAASPGAGSWAATPSTSQTTRCGGDGRFSGTLIVHMRGGAITRLPLRVADGLRPSETFLPILPGVMPAGNTAA